MRKPSLEVGRNLLAIHLEIHVGHFHVAQVETISELRGFVMLREVLLDRSWPLTKYIYSL